MSNPSYRPSLHNIKYNLFILQHEGGRTKPIMDKYIQMIFIDTWNMQFRLDLLDGATMIMPGEQATIRIT